MTRFVLSIALPLVAIGMLSTSGGVGRERLEFENRLLQSARALSLALDAEVERLNLLVNIFASVAEWGEERLGQLSDGMRGTPGDQTAGPAQNLLGRVAVQITPWQVRAEDAPVADAPVADALVADSLVAEARAEGAPGDGVPAPQVPPVTTLQRLPDGSHAVAVARRVLMQGRELRLALVLPTSELSRLLQVQGLPADWRVAMVDDEGTIIARAVIPCTGSEQPFLDTRGPSHMMALVAGGEGGIVRGFAMPDGQPAILAMAHAQRSPFAVAVAAPSPGPMRDLAAVLGLPALAGALLMVGAVWAARRVAAQFQDGIAGLVPGAAAAPCGVRELDQAGARLRDAEAASAEATRRLEESEARHRLAIEAFAGGIYECRPQEGVVIRSPGHLRIIGEEVDTPRREWWLDRIHPEDRTTMDAALAQVREDRGNRFEVEYRVQHRNGQFVWIWHRSIATRDEEGLVCSIVGSVIDITSERQARDAKDLMAQEMHHRVKNSFAVIASLISLTASRWPAAQEFAEELRGRVMALTDAHDIVLNGNGDTSLHGLLRMMTAPHEAALDARRIMISGEDMPLLPPVVPPFALMLHEWLTNAAKYGALSVRGGELHIATRREGRYLVLDWRESAGPPVTAPPDEDGFGTFLSNSTVQGMGGRLRRDWLAEGLRLTLEIELDRVAHMHGLAVHA